MGVGCTSVVAMVFRLLWLRNVLTRVIGSSPELLWPSGEILSPPKSSPVLHDPVTRGRVGPGGEGRPAAGWELRPNAPLGRGLLAHSHPPPGEAVPVGSEQNVSSAEIIEQICMVI